MNLITEQDLPATRDKFGHLVKYPGRIVYVHDNWRLVYVSTIDGKHEFLAESFEHKNLGSISFESAKTALIELSKGTAQ